MAFLECPSNIFPSNFFSVCNLREIMREIKKENVNIHEFLLGAVHVQVKFQKIQDEAFRIFEKLSNAAI